MRGIAPPSARSLAGLLLLVWALSPAASASAEEGSRLPPPVPIADGLRPVDPWLRNDEWAVRSIALLDLRTHAEAGVVFLAARTLGGETNTYAAACALKALEGRPRLDLVMEGGPLLADALMRYVDHAHPTVQARARRILMQMPSIRLGDDFERYRGWLKRGRSALDMEQRELLAKVGSQTAKRPSTATGAVEDTAQDDLYEHLERIRKHGLELCVVMDDTGSMGPAIGAAKAGATRLVNRLQVFVPKFRAGLVTYKDGARLRIPLTHNSEALDKAFRKVGVGGGGDFEEGVDKGIRMALEQELMGWSRSGQHVLVVVGDAPPHENDVARLLRDIARARNDDLYDFPVVIHTVSTHSGAVDHFPQIARAGGGAHVTLRQVGRLVDELILLAFGGGEHRERVERWVKEIDALRAAEKKK